MKCFKCLKTGRTMRVKDDEAFLFLPVLMAGLYEYVPWEDPTSPLVPHRISAKARELMKARQRKAK
jgi:hypothetical protein